MVVHFQPSQAELIPRAGFGLYLSIDDDTEHRLPGHLRPRAYWAIDTHRDFDARLARTIPWLEIRRLARTVISCSRSIIIRPISSFCWATESGTMPAP
jgi:hypothetical protein